MRRTIAAITVAFVMGGLLRAEVSGEAAEQRAIAVVGQISQQPLDNYAEFIETHLDPSFIERRGFNDLERIFAMLARNHQEISVEKIDAEGNSLKLLGQDSAGSWLRFQFEFGEKPEYLINGFGVQRTSAPRAPDASKLTETQWLRTFTQFVQTRADADVFSGAVIIAKGNTPLYASTFGDANKERHIPNELETPINLGSMNKMFTGLAIAQLVANKKLSYDDLVGKHLPDYPLSDVREKVTIHHLLTHTAGLDSYWNDAYESRKGQLRTTKDFVELFQSDPLLFEPGARFHYSNNGPVVLGLIIEALSGMDYYDYVRKNIYQAAEMAHSDHYEVDDQKAGFAVGYYKQSDETRWQNNTPTLGRKGSAGGGGYASANDLLRFSVALMSDKLLSRDHLDTLIAGKIAMGPDAKYAYLFGDHMLNKQRFVGHNGGAPGISAEFSIFPDLGYTIIVLSNYDRAAMPIANKARELIAYNN